MNAAERNLLKMTIDTRLRRLQLILSNNNNDSKQLNFLEDESARLDGLNQIPVDDTLLNIARLEKAQLLANKVWIETDDAGLCRNCGTDIPVERLLTVPTTRLCIHCAKNEQE